MSLPVFIHHLDQLTAGDDAPTLASAEMLAGDPTGSEPAADFPATVGQSFSLTGSEARHAATVKRLGPGDDFILADATGHAIRARIVSVDGKTALTAIVQDIEPPTVRTPRCIVVQAIPKSDRSELAVDLLTQAGVDAIVPWQSERTISRWDRGSAKAIKARGKWVQAAIAAMKQSRRHDLPIVTQVASNAELMQWCSSVTAKGGQVLVLHETATDSLAHVVTARERGETPSVVVVVVGPEGGMSDNELQQLTAHGAECVLLGPEVYRTAAAGAFALSALGVLTDRWRSE